MRAALRGALCALSCAQPALAASAAAPADAHRTSADPVARWQPLAAEAARRFALPADWILRVIAAESGGRVSLGGRPIRSRTGAIGLMQLMPATWEAMRDRHGLGPDPDDPRDNILAGTAFLKMMYDRFGYPGLFAAYNAGPARYAAFRDGMRSLPVETIVYLGKMAGSAFASPSSPRLVASPSLKASPGLVASPARIASPRRSFPLTSTGLDTPRVDRLFALRAAPSSLARGPASAGDVSLPVDRARDGGIFAVRKVVP